MSKGIHHSPRMHFMVFKLPFLLATVMLGFILEFLYELPFMLMVLLRRRFVRRRRR